MVSLSIVIVIACLGLAVIYSYISSYLRAEQLRCHRHYEVQLQELERSYQNQLLETERKCVVLDEKCVQLEQQRDDLQRTISHLQSRYADALEKQNPAFERIAEVEQSRQERSPSYSDLQSLKETKFHLIQEVALLKQEQQQLRRNLENQKLDKSLLQDKLLEMKRVLNSLHQEQTELRSENAQLENRHYHLMEQDEVVRRHQMLERDKKALESQVAQMRNQLNEYEKRFQQQIHHERNLRRVSIISRQHGNSGATQEVFLATINMNFDTVIHAIEFAEYLYADVLEVWDSARQSAYESNFLRPHDVYLNLQALAWFGREYFAKDGEIGMGVYQALTALQCDYAASESKSVQNNEKLFNQRVFRTGNTRKRMLEHLRVGTGTGANRNLRIYFALNLLTKKVEIGHCGKHLGT